MHGEALLFHACVQNSPSTNFYVSSDFSTLEAIFNLSLYCKNHGLLIFYFFLHYYLFIISLHS